MGNIDPEWVQQKIAQVLISLIIAEELGHRIEDT